MNVDSLEAKLAAMQTRLDELERAQARRRRLWTTASVSSVLLVAGVAFAQAVPFSFVGDQPALASEINSNFSALSTRTVPSGAVVFFNLAACPTNWTAVANLRGRTIVGVPTGGNLNGVLGAALPNLTFPIHQHRWSAFAPGTSTSGNWTTWDNTGSSFVLTAWTDGMNTDGAGDYPLSNSDRSAKEYFTEGISTGMPFVQLLACSKN